jgi:hypothetical protein
MDRPVISLEAFEATLRGTITTWYLKDGSPAHAPGFAEQIYTESPPVQRKILLAAPKSSQAWTVIDDWSIIYRPQSSQDWSIVLTIIQNQGAPFLVCSTPDLQIPQAFFQRLSQKSNPHMTFIMYAALGTLPQADTYFFPCISPVDTHDIELLDKTIKKLIGNAPFQLKEALKDIYGAQAGLVVSRVDLSHYSVFWYYASGGQKKGAAANPFVELVQAYLSQGI